jgi:hypothetical protein
MFDPDIGLHLLGRALPAKADQLLRPKFHEVPESILLIRSGIAENSLSGYWEHPN